MGWAEGLQSGMQLGSLINQGLDRRELAEEAKKHRIEEVVPEQGRMQDLIAQRDAAAQGLIAQGVDQSQAYQQATQSMLPQIQNTAQEVGVGRQYTYGGQTFTDRGEAERALSAGRTQGLANVYRTQGNEEKASELEARAMQNRAAGLQVNKLQREEDKTMAYETGLKELNAKEFEKPEMRTAAILDLIEKTQGPAARMQLESQYTQNDLNKITLKAKQFEDGFKQAFTKGTDATMKWLDEQDPGFTLHRVGNQIIQTNLDGSKRVFAQGNENQIMEQFAGHASPSNFLMLSKNIADRQNDERRTAATEKYYASRGTADRMGSAQYFTGDDGNTYASIPTMTKEGLKFETVKVNPDGLALKKTGGANDGKPVKIEEEGTKMSIGGKTVIADGNGNWIPADGNGRPQGVLPSERLKVLKEAGVPENLVGQLPWNKTGTGVLFNGKEYNPKDAKDLKLLADTYKRLGAADIAMEEDTKRTVGLQQQFRNLNGQQPGLYQDPDLWSLYRNQERNRSYMP